MDQSASSFSAAAEAHERALFGARAGRNGGLADIFQELAQAKGTTGQAKRRSGTPPPSNDVDLLGRRASEGQLTTTRAGSSLLPAPSLQRGSAVELGGATQKPIRYNLCMDGSRPFLCGGYARGQLLGPTPGFLPNKDLSHWDKERVTLPDRARPLNGRAADAAVETMRPAEAWKPGRWARGAVFEKVSPANATRERRQNQTLAQSGAAALRTPSNVRPSWCSVAA
eukprot:TRINITY_DN19437_c0_g1_i1.p1 TRINITY_DN19437_c0_g1~~TRINITY_DN19437_c0_g1_i1.p1  ORF type:complete len:226 (-),score=50.04 TRINITY_DN19437_c0_g1_i1:177-854(-)